MFNWGSNNGTLNDNNISGLDNDNDNYVVLYAKWTPKYSDENDVLVDSSELTTATFAAFYSDYVDAFVNNAYYESEGATPVYRNFYLVNANGTLTTPTTTLPSGLHLNKRTGEIYGVPTTVGDYTFYVRMANDEGNWISLSKQITISIVKPLLNIDMKDDNTGIEKTYGSNDPGFYSDQLTVTSPGISSVTLDSLGSGVRLNYEYTSVKAARLIATQTFTPATTSTLKFASDLLDINSTYVPVSKAAIFSMDIQRTSGEDSGFYKLYLGLAERV